MAKAKSMKATSATIGFEQQIWDAACELLESLKKDHNLVITLEDGILNDGFGEKIASFYGTSEMKVKNYGLEKEFYD